MTATNSVDRLTDATLVQLEDIALLRPSAADRIALEVQDQAAKRYFVNLVLEVKERRALDLSPADVEKLKALSKAINRTAYHGGLGLEESGVYLSLLDRILVANGATP